MAGGPVIRPDQVLERFSRAAPTYAGDAQLQRAMAWRLAQLSRQCSIRRACGQTSAAAPVFWPQPWKPLTRAASDPP